MEQIDHGAWRTRTSAEGWDASCMCCTPGGAPAPTKGQAHQAATQLTADTLAEYFGK